MKIFIASDIHGDAVSCERLLQAYKESGADRLVLLGDILYHGPRNDLPAGYAPKKVIPLLGAYQLIFSFRSFCSLSPFGLLSLLFVFEFCDYYLPVRYSLAQDTREASI